MKNFLTLFLALILSWYSAACHPLHVSSVSPEFGQFRSGLFAIASDASEYLLDGTLNQYDTGYSNNIDGKDARKLSNPGENIAVLRSTTLLVVERRHTFQENDTIFFKVWNLRKINYRLQLIAYHMNSTGRIGILKDSYLKTDTPISLNDTTNFIFSVTSDPASSAPDRFMVVFETPSLFVLPLTFTSFRAHDQKGSVLLDWMTSNELGLKQYQVEKSLNGSDFASISQVKANNSSLNHYEFVDKGVLGSHNFYRIRSVSVDGKAAYSDIVKVDVREEPDQLVIFPNPVTNNTLNLRITDQAVGSYEIRLMNLYGQILVKKEIHYYGGVSTERIRIEQKIPKGIYQVQIKTPAGQAKTIRVFF